MKSKELQIKIKVSDTYKKFFRDLAISRSTGHYFVEDFKSPELPEYKTSGSSGLDLYWIGDKSELDYYEHDIFHGSRFAGSGLMPGQFKLFGTGIYISIPEGYEAQIRSRSGLAAKNGVFVLNSPGTVDCDFRNELKVILANFSDEVVELNPGDRIAQLVFAKAEHIQWDLVEELDETERGTKGFGSTGV